MEKTKSKNRTVHVVGFSGGIDSQACLRWVLNRNDPADVYAVNSDAGKNEHPLTTEFIENYSANVHPVEMVTAIVADMGNRGKKKMWRGKVSAAYTARSKYKDSDPLTFDVLAEIKGRFPSRRAQFCTEHLKLAPAKRWQSETFTNGETIIRYAGVRRDESRKRRNAKAVDYDDYFECELRQPIVDWTKQMAFDYVQGHGEAINELYTLGFNRVGCAPCINSGKEDVRAWADRSPDMIDKVRGWEKRVGRTFFAPCVPGMEINWVDDVVKWSKTVHGGKQMSLTVLQERPACESKYGLCE